MRNSRIMKLNAIDFFSGLGTTAQAVMELNKEDGGNRKFICVQLPEKCDENSEAYKAGYKTIAEISKERIRRVIKKLIADERGQTTNENNNENSLNLIPEENDCGNKSSRQSASVSGKKNNNNSEVDINNPCQSVKSVSTSSNSDFGFKVFKLQESNFKIWRGKIENEDELISQLQNHLEPLDENADIENVLYELLLKSGVPLTAKIEKSNGVHFINENELCLALEKIDADIIKFVISKSPRKIITLDRLFNNNDQLKTNISLQLKDADIKFTAI